MMLPAIAVLCTLAADPWVVNPAYKDAPTSLRTALPDVHEVRTDERFVHVTSAGLSLHSFGVLEANQYEAPIGPRALSFDFPRAPMPAQGGHVNAPLGIIGAFATGVPIYNPIGTASWQDQNLWHRDAVAMSSAASPLLDSLTRQMAGIRPLSDSRSMDIPSMDPLARAACGRAISCVPSQRVKHGPMARCFRPVRKALR